jgi:SH3 domain.
MIDQDQTSVTHRKFIVKAIARYTYKPQQHGELFFKKGWQLYIIHKQEDNWFFCELGANADDRAGMVGLVPGNYLVEGNHLF